MNLTTKLPVDQHKQEKLISSLFNRWELTNEEKAMLLGVSSDKFHQFNNSNEVICLSLAADAQERVEYFLNIHKSLGILFPENSNMKYGWMKIQNKDLGDKMPIEIIASEQVNGIRYINDYLEKLQFG